MRILVTGGAGFIGSHTVDALLRQGYAVRVLDALCPPVHPKSEWPDYLAKEAELIVGDVRSKQDWERSLEHVDAVFHMASYQDLLPAFGRFAQVNDAGTALLYEVIVEKGLSIQKVVLASSQAVYGEGKYVCRTHGALYPEPRPLEQLQLGRWEIHCRSCGAKLEPTRTDESVVHPANQYGVSKYAQEMYALILGRLYGVPTVALRYSIVQGPRQSPWNAYSGVLRVFATRLLGGKAPIVYEDGQQVRDYVGIQDVIAANLLVLERNSTDYGVFNVGGDRAVTVLEYAALLCRLIGVEFQLQVSGEFRLGDTRHIISDVSKLKDLGWRPKVSVEDIARAYLEWVHPLVGSSNGVDAAIEDMRTRGVLRRVRA